MPFPTRALPVALLLACVLPGMADAATHTIRIEGDNRTLLAETQVTVPDSGDIAGTGGDCQWNEPGGAIEQATSGAWSRARFVTDILGEHHSGANKTSWYIFTNGKISAGACDETLSGPTEIVIGPAPYDPNTGNPSELPATIVEAPTTIAPDQSFRVKVVEPNPVKNPDWGYYETGTGQPSKPAEGVTVTAGSAVGTTGADGYATLAVGQTGPVSVQAHRQTGLSRSKAMALCVTNGKDGACGTTVERPAIADTCRTTGADGLCGTRDRLSPVAKLRSVKEGQVFTRGKGPRVLRGTAPDVSGLHAVKLRLTRTDGETCSTWSRSKERFVPRRCGAANGYWFVIGTQPDWEYQLAERLPRGRYVLDVNAIDKAFNRDDQRRRGENRAVFTVR